MERYGSPVVRGSGPIFGSLHDDAGPNVPVHEYGIGLSGPVSAKTQNADDVSRYERSRSGNRSVIPEKTLVGCSSESIDGQPGARSGAVRIDLKRPSRVRGADSHVPPGRSNRHRTKPDVLHVVDKLVPHGGVEVGRPAGTRIRVIRSGERNVGRASDSGDGHDGNEGRGPKGGAVHDGKGVFRGHGSMVTLRENLEKRFYSGEMHAPSSGHHQVHWQMPPRFAHVFGTEKSSIFDR